jgi:hypothetical protein
VVDGTEKQTMTLAIVDNSSAILRIGVVLASLMAACIVCLLVALWMRRWVKDSDPPKLGLGFTLSDLRQMHRDGHLTTEEFEKAKEKILASARRNLVQANKGKPAAGPIPPPPDSEGGEGAG